MSIELRLQRLAMAGNLNLVQQLELYIRMEYLKNRKKEDRSPQLQGFMDEIGELMDREDEHGHSMANYLENQHYNLRGVCEGCPGDDTITCDNESVTCCAKCGLEVCMEHAWVDYETGDIRCSFDRCMKE